ncbi:HdeA/HdeB family protein [Bauldia litoralis]|uniref:HdeA/HdeB family protein n=2 Tax=Bauldia litoralis TaxID=665467 RepID=A0A1G6DF98_9HYPH|nr:HdeA/HdeB family protein [Bauldia litoralis]
MAAIDCQGLLSMSAEEVVVTGAWMSGYFNGRADNTVLDTEMMPAYGAALGEYCENNPEALVMQAVKTLFDEAE